MHMYQYDLYKVTRDSNLRGSAERMETKKKNKRGGGVAIYTKKSYHLTNSLKNAFQAKNVSRSGARSDLKVKKF
jgi:hypothetical protein